MHRLLLRVLGVLVVALPFFLTVRPHTASAAVAPPELRVVTWNICGEAGGNPGFDSYCPYRTDPQRKANEIARVVTEHGANVVLLQEICGGEDGSQLSLLATALGSGWSYRHALVQRPADGASYCRGTGANDLKGDLGVAVLVKATITATTDQPTVPSTPTVNLQQLPLLCVRTAEWTTRLCTTHVLADATDPRRPGQVDTIENLVWPDRHDLVLGGDFNFFPESRELADLEATFDECDRQSYGVGDTVNEETHLAWNGSTTQVWRKRDHIFAARPGAGTLFRYCDADLSRVDTTYYGLPDGSNGYSDHAPLVGYLRTRTPGAPATPGDLTGDGRADLIAIDAAGQLRLYDGRGNGRLNWPNGIIGTGGWTGAAISHRGDFTGDGTEDVLARVGDGLWVYPNRGYGRLSDRIALGGSGWSAVSQVLSVGDITGDGRPDVVAVRANQLYLHASDPLHQPGLLPPVLIGSSGWSPMTLTAPGDADHDGRPDLLVRDTGSGVLYLYRGQANGRFDDRSVYGTTGWTSTNRPLLAAGDADGNGVADLWATAADGKLFFYAGDTNSAGDPSDGPWTEVGTGWQTISRIA